MEQFLPKQAYFIDATESIFLANYFETANVKSAKSAVNYFVEKQSLQQSLQYPSLKTTNNFTKEVAPNILGAAISYLNHIKKPVKVVVEHHDTIYFYFYKLHTLNANQAQELKTSLNSYTILKFENMYSYFYNIKAYKCRKDKKNTLHIFNLQASLPENINIFFDKVKKFEIGEML